MILTGLIESWDMSLAAGICLQEESNRSTREEADLIKTVLIFPPSRKLSVESMLGYK